MQIAPDPSEIVARPAAGRVFTAPARPGFADCSPSGRTRLDSLARWLQDVAYADVEDAGLADAAVWVLRRTRIQVSRWPRFGEEFRLSTFCSGIGRMWAERRTTVARARAQGDARGSGGDPEGAGGAPEVEAVSLWVHLDPESWRPTQLSEAEHELYGPSAGGRRVTARLHHPQPQGIDGAATWAFRHTELDVAAHINNVAYWQPLEEELLAGEEPGGIDAEIEFRTPAQPGEKLLIADGGPPRAGAMRWIGSADGEIHASILVARMGS